MVTISAFYFGDTLHPRTALHLSPIFTKSPFSCSSLNIVISESPAMINANCFSFFFSLSVTFFKAVFSSTVMSSLFLALTNSWSRFLSSSSQENPMFIAVSILSPVRTQILIPACLRFRIVLPTSSWSLSSIAVAPTSFRSFSISSYTSIIFYFLFFKASFA